MAGSWDNNVSEIIFTLRKPGRMLKQDPVTIPLKGLQ